MFTGIIEEIGTIKSLQPGLHSLSFEVEAHAVLAGTRQGDSISTDGVCLTVTQLTPNGFKADVMHETLHRSTLALASVGRKVNLERAMKADGRFGGHIVSGHIDGRGEVTNISRDDNAYLLTIQCRDSVLKYVVEKGSVCLNGVSLTVASVHQNGFLLSIIPHTWRETTLGLLKQGDAVNLENDIVGKYIERFMTFKNRSADTPRLTEDFLKQCGF